MREERLLELWDLYTWDRQKTGRTCVRGTPVPHGLMHMVVHVIVFNTRGEMLCQQRQSFKEGYPNLWDISAGGSALAGEDRQSAAQRETFEELGLRVSLAGQAPHFTLHVDNYFSDYYLVTQDVDLASLHLQQSEVQAARWLTQDDILRMLDEGTFCPYHRSFIELLFGLRNCRGALAHL